MLRSGLRAASRLGRLASSASLSAIRQLRERTGAPIHEVKAALSAADWDADAALKELQRRGLLAASKKASRVAAEGLVGVASSAHSAVLVEVNAETDFVTRNTKFQELVRDAANAALGLNRVLGQSVSVVESVPLDALLALPSAGDVAVSAAVAAVAAEVRENVLLRRASWVRAEGGVVGAYVHGGTADLPVGRMGGVVVLEPSGALEGSALEAVSQLAHGLAMHVVASRPSYVSEADIPPAVLESQRAAFAEKAAALKKPAGVEAQMVAGQLSKWQAEVCLLNQPYLLNDAATAKAAIDEAATRAGIQLTVRGFARLQAGEGVEREAADFASEVASLTKG